MRTVKNVYIMNILINLITGDPVVSNHRRIQTVEMSIYYSVSQTRQTIH